MNRPTSNTTTQQAARTGALRQRSEYEAFLEDIHAEECGHLDIDTVLRDRPCYDERDLAAINNDEEGDGATLLSLYEAAGAAGAERTCVYKARSLEYHTQQSRSSRFSRLQSERGTFGQTSSPAYAGQMHTSIAYDLSYFIYSEYFLRPYKAVCEALAEDIVAQRLKQGTAQLFAFIAYANRAFAERHAEFIAIRQARREAKLSLIAKEKLALQEAITTTPVEPATESAYATEGASQTDAFIMQNTPELPQNERASVFALADILPTDDAYHRYFDTPTNEVSPARDDVPQEETAKSRGTLDPIGLIAPSKPPVDYDAWTREINAFARKLFVRVSTTASEMIRKPVSPEHTTPTITTEATIVNLHLVARAPSNAHERRFPVARAHDGTPEYTTVRDMTLDIRDEQLSAIEQSARTEDVYEYSEEPVVLRKPARSSFAFSIPCDPIGVDRTPRRVLRKKRSGIISFLDGVSRINAWMFIKLSAGVWLIITILLGLLKTVGVFAF